MITVSNSVTVIVVPTSAYHSTFRVEYFCFMKKRSWFGIHYTYTIWIKIAELMKFMRNMLIELEKASSGFD